MTKRIELKEPIMVWELCEVLPQYETPQFVSYFLNKDSMEEYMKNNSPNKDKTWQYGCGELDKAIEQQILDDHNFRNNFEELFPWDKVKFAGKIQELEQENKNMREGLQAHREELEKSRTLYKILKLDFEDLAKEDCAIRQKAIKDIMNLKKQLEQYKSTIDKIKELANHDKYEYEPSLYSIIEDIKVILDKLGDKL